MPYAGRAKITLFAAIAAAGLYTSIASTQGDARPTNEAPNPFQSAENHFKLPEGRTWGSTSAVEIDRDGRSIWVAERCGANSCLDRASGQMSKLPVVLKFDTGGKLVKSFGEGLLIFPHGIFLDREGNVWLTDGQDDAPAPARGTGGGRAAPGEQSAGGARWCGAQGARGGGRQGRTAPPPGTTRGHQVFKFSPDGKLLMTLGKPGGAGEPDYFYQPNDVLVAPNGDIFVSEGHSSAPGSNARILRFDKSGKLIKTFGKFGSGPGEFDQPHALAMDSRGRLFVGDRNNNRVQILDQNGQFIAEWKQFSRPSGLFIDKNDNLYVADSESESVASNHNGWKRGIRVGSAKDGSLKYFIPDPETRMRPDFTGTSAAEGVAVDAQGNIYGAEVGPKRVMKSLEAIGNLTRPGVEIIIRTRDSSLSGSERARRFTAADCRRGLAQIKSLRKVRLRHPMDHRLTLTLGFARCRRGLQCPAGTRSRLTASDAAKGLAELVEVQRFAHEPPGAQLARPPIAVDRARHHDDRDPGERSIAQLHGPEVKTVHHRQDQFEHDDARLGVRAQVMQGLTAVADGLNAVALCLKGDHQ